MGNTLKDDMKADFAATFLNTTEFAEEVTFYPADGGASRTLTVTINSRQRGEDKGPINYEVEVITVQVLKDESHAKGGIATPVREAGATAVDRILRSGDSEKFAFTGRVLGEPFGGTVWRLEFERSKFIRGGTGQRR